MRTVNSKEFTLKFRTCLVTSVSGQLWTKLNLLLVILSCMQVPFQICDCAHDGMNYLKTGQQSLYSDVSWFWVFNASFFQNKPYGFDPPFAEGRRIYWIKNGRLSELSHHGLISMNVNWFFWAEKYFLPNNISPWIWSYPVLFFFRITQDGSKGPRPRRISEPSGDEEDLQLLSPEERDRRKSFEQKRKMHYNEYYAVKMARQLMQVHTGAK